MLGWWGPGGGNLNSADFFSPTRSSHMSLSLTLLRLLHLRQLGLEVLHFDLEMTNLLSLCMHLLPERIADAIVGLGCGFCRLQLLLQILSLAFGSFDRPVLCSEKVLIVLLQQLPCFASMFVGILCLRSRILSGVCIQPDI